MRKLLILAALAAVLAAVGCSPEQNARDVIAAGSGAIAKAQSIYGNDCLMNPREGYCALINQAVRAENLAITSLETYCGFSQSPIPPDASAPCVPQKTAEGALKSAIGNLNRLTKEINALIARRQTGGK